MREDINKQNEYGNTKLHSAVYRGDIAEVARLLDMGADVTIRNKHGKTATDLAIENEEHEILELLADAEVDRDLKGGTL